MLKPGGTIWIILILYWISIILVGLFKTCFFLSVAITTLSIALSMAMMWALADILWLDERALLRDRSKDRWRRN
jgi:hypothetical protein